MEGAYNYLTALIARLFYREPKVVDRGTGEVKQEEVPAIIKAQIGVLYNSWLGLVLAKLPPLWQYQLRHSEALGRRYDSPESRGSIKGFVKDYGVRLDELEKPLDQFHTLNEFFARKLRSGARPIYKPEDDTYAVQPADARIVVFPSAQHAQQLWIKARRFTLHELLGVLPAGSQHAIVISRLAPDDYHRFHSPVSGTISAIASLGRQLFSVKSAAVTSRVNVLCENKRVVMQIDTSTFGTVWVVAVGAAQENSAGRVETLVRMGTSLGHAL